MPKAQFTCAEIQRVRCPNALVEQVLDSRERDGSDASASERTTIDGEEIPTDRQSMR